MDTNNERFNDVEKVGKRIQAITELIHDYGIPYHIVFMLLSDVCYLAEIADREEHGSEGNVSDDEDFDDLCEAVDDIYPLYEDEDDDDPYGDYGFEERDFDDEE